MTERDRAQPRYAGDVLRAQEKHVQIVSQNKYFTYDHVFGNDTHQGDIFTALGERPVQKFVEGKIDNKGLVILILLISFLSRLQCHYACLCK